MTEERGTAVSTGSLLALSLLAFALSAYGYATATDEPLPPETVLAETHEPGAVEVEFERAEPRPAYRPTTTRKARRGKRRR